MNGPATGRRRWSHRLRRIRAGAAPAAAPGNCQTDILSARKRQAGELPHRDLSAASRVGRGAVPRFSVEAIAASGAKLAFLATPHEASLELVPQLLEAGLRVVDLSGAFRFRNPETFAQWYKLPAPDAAMLAEAVYGLAGTLRQGSAERGWWPIRAAIRRR